MIHPVILCGGSGTRLWPVSRRAYPKQFAPLLGDTSLFQASLERLSGPGWAEPIVITGSDFRFIAAEQLSAAGHTRARIMLEPVARNTAPAVLCAALALEDDPDALMLVAPSDHVIRDAAGFRACVEAGATVAAQGRMVTFGITPDRAETGYGWLELDGPATPGDPQPLVRFVEKPDAPRAEEMLASGRFLWNAGIFLFRVRDVLAAFEAHAPALVPPCRRAMAEGREDLMFWRLQEEAFAEAEEISVDYAIMEKADNLSVVPFDGGWNDLGAWDAVLREMPRDGDGVALSGPANAVDCHDTLLHSEPGGPRVVGVGLEGMAVIATRDAVAVVPLERAQEIKNAVSALKAEGLAVATDHLRMHRPWGWYETLSLGARFQVKRIMVKPGAKLSLQSHHHRAEHWVVVQGTATVTKGEEELLLTENQSVYLPLGIVHRLANPGKLDLHLIEVQSGPYLGEDDIVRYEDVYARA